MKKIAGDTIILHKFTKNYNHMSYRCWDTEWDRQKIVVILGPFTPLITRKKIFLKKWKESSGDVII